MQAAAVAVDEPAVGGGDQLAEGRHAVAQGHETQASLDSGATRANGER
jgi:hypothetical protein